MSLGDGGDLRSTTLGSWERAPRPSRTSPALPPCCLVWRTVTGSGSTPPGRRSLSPEHETACSGPPPNTQLQTCGDRQPRLRQAEVRPRISRLFADLRLVLTEVSEGQFDPQLSILGALQDAALQV